LESIREGTTDVVRNQANARPAFLRVTDLFRRGAPPGLVVGFSADRIGRERFLEHCRQANGRR
jgi:hypothetical protein